MTTAIHLPHSHSDVAASRVAPSLGAQRPFMANSGREHRNVLFANLVHNAAVIANVSQPPRLFSSSVLRAADGLSKIKSGQNHIRAYAVHFGRFLARNAPQPDGGVTTTPVNDR